MIKNCMWFRMSGCKCKNPDMTEVAVCPFAGKMKKKAPQGCTGFTRKTTITGLVPELLYQSIDGIRKNWGDTVRAGDIELTIKTHDKETTVIMSPRKSGPGWFVKKIKGANTGRVAAFMRE